MDPQTTLSLAGAAYAIEKAGGRELIVKLFGPTAEYFGQAGKGLAERGSENVARVVRSAVRRLGSAIDKPGVIPPRVLGPLLEEAVYCEDELVAEYLGGLLAASRTEDIRRDEAACFVKLV